jgi:AcrR family transcriptional regulator
MSPRVTPENRIPDIIRAAAEVFSRKGYRLAQMEEIAKEAGVSKATLYYYFKNKIHLFYHLLEYGVPRDDSFVAPQEEAPSITEGDMLQILQDRLQKRTSLKSVNTLLRENEEAIDLADELGNILAEIWDLQESNRVQIIILEKSVTEFPELANIYDEYARRRVLHQLERYIESRIRVGAIRRLGSVPAVARMIMESMSWFGWKQVGDTISSNFSQSETLPDFVAILADGLRGDCSR